MPIQKLATLREKCPNTEFSLDRSWTLFTQSQILKMELFAELYLRYLTGFFLSSSFFFFFFFFFFFDWVVKTPIKATQPRELGKKYDGNFYFYFYRRKGQIRRHYNGKNF